MRGKIQQKFKEYFNFRKNDRNGIIVLLCLLSILIIGHIILENFESQKEKKIDKYRSVFKSIERDIRDNANKTTLFKFNPNTISENLLDSLPLSKIAKENLLKYRNAGGLFKNSDDVKKIYGLDDSIFILLKPYIYIPNSSNNKKKEREEIVYSLRKFNPNKVTHRELEMMGFNNFQASNIIKYRESKGHFYDPEDLLKIYGIDSVFFNKIKPYIIINDNERDEKLIKEKQVKVDVFLPVIELNSADSLELLALKGVGPVIANRIIKYRHLLGGFFSTSQLLEVYGFKKEYFYEINKKITVDTFQLKKIRINYADYKQMVRHPYLKKEHVSNIIKYRSKNGPFLVLSQLLKEEILDTTTFKMIKPYFTCR